MVLIIRDTMLLYELWHEYYVPDEDYDVETFIAVYSTRVKVEAALKKFRQHPKFRSHPDSFEIAEIEVDKDGWAEGFNSWDQ